MLQDNLTSAQSVIGIEQKHIHDSNVFSISTNTGSLAAAANYKFVLTTPAASTRKRVHLRSAGLSSSANIMLMQIYEATTNTGGTEYKLDNHYRGSNPVNHDSTFKAGATAALTGKNIIASTAGGNFGNQPNNDGVEIVSDDAADIGQVVTLYGTIHGATTVVISEQITLNGTTAVSSTHTDWSAILGVELSASCAGTVTIREASGNATITTILTTVLSAGVATITDSRARDRILRIDADGASTKIVGVIGTNPAGAAIGYAAALNGATEKDLSAYFYRTVTKVLIGDVESARECWVLRPEVVLLQKTAGASSTNGGRSVDDGITSNYILEPATDYVIYITNAGATTASVGYLDLVIIEEDIIGMP